MLQPVQEDFFDRMHEWSERKLQLLQKYIDPAAKILGNYSGVLPGLPDKPEPRTVGR